MKKIICVLYLFFVWVIGYPQAECFCVKDKNVCLQTIQNKSFVPFNVGADSLKLKNEILKNQRCKIIAFKSHIDKRLNYVQYYAIIEGLYTIDSMYVSYVSPLYLTSAGDEIGISHLFYVKLKNQRDTLFLQQKAKENNVTILGNNPDFPMWYTLSCSKYSSGNVLKVSDIFYRSNCFAVVEPNIILTKDAANGYNDSLYPYQWNLYNTGQYNNSQKYDINWNKASKITQGNNNIVIAIVDEGLETFHSDLTNLYPISYDINSEVLRQW